MLKLVLKKSVERESIVNPGCYKKAVVEEMKSSLFYEDERGGDQNPAAEQDVCILPRLLCPRAAEEIFKGIEKTLVVITFYANCGVRNVECGIIADR